MSCLTNSFDYHVELLGLLPLGFDFSKEENTGIRFQTVKLKKVKKPSEDSHDGQVIISDAQLLRSTAIVETKIICHNTSTPNTTKANDDESDRDDQVTPLADELVQKLNVEGDDDEDSETESEPDVPVDEMMKKEHSVRFLYKSFSNVDTTIPNQPWTIFGITSFGDGCGKRNKFGIYAKVPNYVDWIWSVINCNGNCNATTSTIF